MVADDGVGGGQDLPPGAQRRDDGQPGVLGVPQPGTDLAGAVPVPDVGVQDGAAAVAVDGQFSGKAVQEPGEDVVRVAEQGARPPGRVDDDEALTGGDAEGAAEVVAVGKRGQQAVEARVTGEYGRTGSGRAGAAEAGELLGVGQDGRRGNGLPVAQ
ncbi:hypothetical protein [Streptomyces rimosus]|uniref:hypothetical protein n=1 Tax=Streptomyces rimosus TaxID=1927 RepID=UPI0004C1E124|nr:hypothetical protein [Streptomyces rimosus]